MKLTCFDTDKGGLEIEGGLRVWLSYVVGTGRSLCLSVVALWSQLVTTTEALATSLYLPATAFKLEALTASDSRTVS